MKINLAVPFFSQRENSYKWGYRYEEDKKNKQNQIIHSKGEPVLDSEGNQISETIWDGCCNITCLSMVLNYLGITKDTPKEMSEKIFVKGYSNSNSNKVADFDRYVKYRKISGFDVNKGFQCIESGAVLELIAKEIYSVRNTYVAYNYGFDDVRKEVEAGFPVIVSCGIIRPSLAWMKNEVDQNTASEYTEKEYNKYKEKDTTWEYHGHYIVIRGFTESGDVIINDPWGKATTDSGSLPQKTVNGIREDAWGYYNSNIDSGSNKGENIILKKADFDRQYKKTFHCVIVIYDRRWSYPFSDVLNNYMKTGNGNNIRFVPDKVQFKKYYDMESRVSHYPVTITAQPHLGVDLLNSFKSEVFSMGSGMLVAAKLRNSKTEVIKNGSNCFVLVKHSVRLPGDTKVKTFFILYNHLYPLEKNVEEYGIRFVKELLNESISNINIKSFEEVIPESSERLQNKLKEEATQKLLRLNNGEIVIFNDSNLISEVAEQDLLGYTGYKGFTFTDEKTKLHIEIFSNENIFKDTTKFPGYKEIDITDIDIYNRDKVIERFKDSLLKDFAEDNKFSAFCKYYEANGISPKGFESYYDSEHRISAEKIVVKSKNLWRCEFDFDSEYSKGKGFIPLEEFFFDAKNYSKNYVEPFLWWTDAVNTAINNDLEPKIVNKIVYHYHPINFLYWLMLNDDDLYKEVSPKLLQTELLN